MAALSVQSDERRERGVGQCRAKLRSSLPRPPTTAMLLDARALRRLAEPLRQGADDRPLVRGRQIGAALGEARLAEVAHGVEECGLDAGEREVEARHARHRKPERLRIALPGQRVDLGAAGVRQPEEPRTLVERLAGGVVERRAEPLERPVPPDGQQERVAAAREQADEGRLEGLGPR